MRFLGRKRENLRCPFKILWNKILLMVRNIELSKNKKSLILEFFSHIIQLMPVWVMLLLHFFLNVPSNQIDYASNLYVYVMVTAAGEFYGGGLVGESSFQMKCFCFLEIMIMMVAMVFFSAILINIDEGNSYSLNTVIARNAAIILAVFNVVLSLIIFVFQRVHR